MTYDDPSDNIQELSDKLQEMTLPRHLDDPRMTRVAQGLVSSIHSTIYARFGYLGP